MIDMLGRISKLEAAMKLIQSMPMEPHAGIYGSLLNATSIHNRVELGSLPQLNCSRLSHIILAITCCSLTYMGWLVGGKMLTKLGI